MTITSAKPSEAAKITVKHGSTDAPLEFSLGVGGSRADFGFMPKRGA